MRIAVWNGTASAGARDMRAESIAARSAAMSSRRGPGRLPGVGKRPAQHEPDVAPAGLDLAGAAGEPVVRELAHHLRAGQVQPGAGASRGDPDPEACADAL